MLRKPFSELGTGETPTILVFNKTDAYSYIEKEEDDLTPFDKENLSLEDLKRQWTGNNTKRCLSQP